MKDILKYFIFKTWIFWFVSFSVFAKSVYISLFMAGDKYLVFLLLYSLLFALVISSVILFFRNERVSIGVGLISLSISNLILFADLTYYKYYQSLPSLASISFAKNLGSVTESIGSLVNPLQLLLWFGDILILIVIYRWLKTVSVRKIVNKKVDKSVFFIPFILVLITLFSFSVDYDEYGSRFLNNIYDNQLIVIRYGVFGAHSFDIARILSREAYTIEEIVSAKEKVSSSKYGNQTKTKYFGSAEGKRVIIIQVEALSSSVVGLKLEDKEITPNINRLVEDSTSFQKNYFTIGAGNTSDSDFSVNTSLYPLEDTAAFIRYSNNDFESLSETVEKSGYSAFAYHGNNRGFWSRDSVFRGMGYDYYALDSFPNKKLLGMGVSDEDFFVGASEIIKEKPEKSLHYLISLTSHHPFNLPREDRKIELKDDYSDFFQRYLYSINYADYSIGLFIDSLKREGIYEESLIVLCSDHMPIMEDLTKNEVALFGYSDYNEALPIEEYLKARRVPLLVKMPEEKSHKKVEKVTSNLDIMPTIIDLLGIEGRIMFGRSVFSDQEKVFYGGRYYGGGFIISDEYTYKIVGADLDSGVCWEGSANVTDVSRCANVYKDARENRELSEMIIRSNLFAK